VIDKIVLTKGFPMSEKPDLLTAEVVRQCLSEQVPGFVAVLAESLGLSTVDLLRRLHGGEITVNAAMAALAALAIARSDN
jgi:hypothetical protein